MFQSGCMPQEKNESWKPLQQNVNVLIHSQMFCRRASFCRHKKELRLPVFRTRSGRTIQTNGFVYIMHEERRLGEPHPRYFWTCIKGYRAFGFDPEFLYEAYEKSAQGVR